jgi:hypothetical protein
MVNLNMSKDSKYNKSHPPIEVHLNIQVDNLANKAINSNITTENPENVPYMSYLREPPLSLIVLLSNPFCTIRGNTARCLVPSIGSSINTSSQNTQNQCHYSKWHTHYPPHAQGCRCQLCDKEDESIHHILKCTANPHNYQAATESRYQKKEITHSQYETTLQLLQKILNSEPPPNIHALEDQIQIG